MTANTASKYIFVDGVMKLNPNYHAAGQPQSTVADPSKAIAIVSSTQDIQTASNAQQAATGQAMQLSTATTASMEIMQDRDFLNQFKAPTQLDGGDLLDGLSNIFAKHEIPIGLINKLLALSEYKLNFIIDDSGSMGNKTDALISQASLQVKQQHDRDGRRAASQGAMTRWEEAEDRLHVMIDILAYIPTGKISITFLNRNTPLTLDHAGKTPDMFAQEAHSMISNAFRATPTGGTPIYGRLTQSFMPSSQPTMHYLFTDGEPSDATAEQVGELIVRRANPKANPLTFVTCTDDNSQAEWMKKIEGDAEYTSELDDFYGERKEVLEAQGPGFPFNKGLWLICHLVAAINPIDLDALDEKTPFTKKTMDDLMGRKLTQQEYFRYFDSNPNAVRYRQQYLQFAREDIIARDVLRNMQGAAQPAYGQPQQPAQAPYMPAQQQPAPAYGAAQNQTMWGQQPQQQQAYAPQSGTQPVNQYAPSPYRR